MSTPTPPGPPPHGRLRAIAMLAAVVALGAGFAAAVIAVSDSAGQSDESSGWNTVAAVDFVDGDVTLYDAGGERIDRISTDIDEPRIHQVSPSHLVLEGLRSDRETIAIVDTSSGEVLDFDLGDDIARDDRRNLNVRPVPGTNAFLLGDDGQPGTAYVMTVDGDVVDIGRAARWDDPFIIPGAAQVNPDGSMLAVFDAGGDNVETALISLPDLDVTVVDGGFVSLSNDTVRTRTSGDDAGLEVQTFDLDGSRIGSFETDRFRLGLDATNGDLITASDDGEVVRWSGDGTSDRLATFDVGDGSDFARMTRTFGSEPTIAVAGLDDELLLVGNDGAVIDDIDLDAPVTRFDFGADCLPVITETSIALIELETGAVLVEEPTGDGLPGFIGAIAQGGCVLTVFGEEELLIGGSETIEFDSSETLAGLSDDGSAFAVRSRDGEFEIRAYGDASTDPVNLDADEFSRIYFVER